MASPSLPKDGPAPPTANEEPMTTTDAKDLYDKGYGDLVSIIPPDAVLSPLTKIPPEHRGKVPGRRTPQGWVGYNWRAAPAVRQQDVDEWQGGVGIRADYFPAVDIDVLDPTLSSLLQQIAVAELGLAPLRIGRAPKALLMYRTSEPFKRARLWIGDAHLVEVLGAGQQFLASGIHPATGKPYTWSDVPEADDLTTITSADVDRFLAAAQDACEMLGYDCRIEGGAYALADRNAIDQDALIADDAERVIEAIKLIPNTNELFPGRNDYLRMGYAIKGALGEEGLPLFVEWAEKWEGNGTSAGNTAESATADWRRMRPPFEVGAPYLFEIAQNFGFNAASDEFEVGEASDDLDFDGPGGPIMYSDAACAFQFITEYSGELRYVAERSKWLGWDGSHWALGDGAAAEWRAGKMLNAMSNKALKTVQPAMKAEQLATRLASVGTRSAIVRYASSAPGMRVTMADLDADPNLLNTPDGVYDLRTGERRDADPNLLMTRCTTVAPEFEPPVRWLAFLDEATAGDKELQRYLQRLTGYALTGLKTEHNLAFIYGPGGNGKGVFLNTVQAIFGDYAKAANMDTFTASKFDKHPTDMAGLAGSRLVTAQETQEGRSWDEAKVKMLTSADKVQARFMREDFFEFEPTFKLIFAGNHKPEIRNLDDAMKRRFHLVPFTVKPKTINPLLSEQLREEWPRILAWMIEGTRMWLAEGLNPPAVVLEATAEYFDEEDPIGQWIRERVDRSDTTAPFVTSTDVYDNWREWAGENGEYGRNVKTLVRELKGRGFRAARTSTARGFTGIKFTAGPGAADYAGSEFL